MRLGLATMPSTALTMAVTGSESVSLHWLVPASVDLLPIG